MLIIDKIILNCDFHKSILKESISYYIIFQSVIYLDHPQVIYLIIYKMHKMKSGRVF